MVAGAAKVVGGTETGGGHCHWSWSSRLQLQLAQPGGLLQLELQLEPAHSQPVLVLLGLLVKLLKPQSSYISLMSTRH